MQVLPCQDKKSGTRSLADFTLKGSLVNKPAKQLMDLVNLPLIFLTRKLLYALFLIHRVPVTPSLYFSVYCVLMMIFVRLFLLFYFNFAVLRYMGTKFASILKLIVVKPFGLVYLIKPLRVNTAYYVRLNK